MTDENIRLLLRLTGEEARLLLDQNEHALYRRIQKKMVKLVREYEVRLPLDCLQFVYCEKRVIRPNCNRYREAEVELLGLDNLR